MEHKRIYLYSAVAWTCVIAILCLVNFSGLPSVGVKNTDKLVHFVLHFVFTALWILYLISKTEKWSLIKIYGIIFSVSLSYGILIEIAQDLFTVSRRADILDVCANATGSIIAIAVLIAYKNMLPQINSNK
ncbi:MAG: VanZ family protein [Bacteroidota bacterium]